MTTTDTNPPTVGRQVSSEPILMSPPEIGNLERQAVMRALDSGWIAPAGSELDSFQDELADYVGAEAALATSSGTGALHVALLALGVQPGDEVVVQTTTFAASAFSVAHAGAIPVFCDTDAKTGMMDPDVLADFLSQRAKAGNLPAAVMPVDLYGYCADYQSINEVCARYDIPVLQDAAEAIGAKAQGKFAGTHGVLGVFSFNGNKIITTSGGGALVGPPELIARASKLSTQAREPVAHYEHTEIGFNYRMSNILAALGRAQLARLPERVEQRAKIAAFYPAALPDFDWFPQGVTESPNYWLNVGLLPAGIDPTQVVAHMSANKIEARRSWKPMHMQPVFSDNEFIGGTHAESFYARGITLPSAQSLTESDLDRVVSTLNEACEL